MTSTSELQATLPSEAEKLADSTRQLPEFSNFSLPGVRHRTSELLNAIGRVDNLFSTYTKHDISHIDSVLGSLDWIIDPDTRPHLTPVDWLLITLSIYFHDLGMAATAEEFEQRYENTAFREFLDHIRNDPGPSDYLARANQLPESRRESFFYQEFLRHEHAARIREWITGRISSYWGSSVAPLADEIAELLKDLPSRFRETLALVCESHHKDDLADRNLYPLCQRFGSHPDECANVLYAAVILRTADLLHVTRDRTPSVMYKALGITDPLGIDEWEKQLGTFSVYHATRDYDRDDPDTHVIEINADFSEERPYFALTEYIAYADSQIKQSKRWVDAAQSEPDGKNFRYPWHRVKEKILVQGNAPVPLSFELDRGRLLDLLVGHTLYNDPHVALRELLQNALDAVRFQQHTSEQSIGHKKYKGHVKVSWTSENRTLVIEDNGVGMTLDVIQQHLMKVGSSFYDTPTFHTSYPNFSAISRFGIGILTTFMISDDIEIITTQGNGGHRIKMTSVHANYLLKKIPNGDTLLQGLDPHGTRIRLRVRSTIDLDSDSVEDILRHWVVLPDCAVTFEADGGESKKIGFDSPGKALTSYYIDQESESARQSREYYVMEKSFLNQGATYELAFLTEVSKFLPERTVVTDDSYRGRYYRSYAALSSTQRKIPPKVCIEGIRADNQLAISPGVRQEFAVPGSSEPAALLSVTGNQKFRTTVSRSTLEKDEEYDSVARICLDFLVDYVREEIARIANNEGSPLSQASTAGNWLIRTLYGIVGTLEGYAHVNEKTRSIPRIVVEATDSQGRGKKKPVVRKLISVEEFEELPYFYTVDSRVVDYLGTMSRDLGQELSVNEFLMQFLPKLEGLRLSPILPDSRIFADEIRVAFIADEVTFSRKFQHAAIKWVSTGRDEEGERVKIEPMIDRIGLKRGQELRREIFGLLGEDVGLTDRIHSEMGSSFYSYNPYRVEVKGDLDNIEGISTPMGIFITKNSTMAKIFDILDKSIESNALTESEIILLYVFRVLALQQVMGRFGRTMHSRYDPADLGGLAERLWPRVCDLLHAEGPFSKNDLEWSSIIGDRDRWFNAREYWRDWADDQR